MALTIRFQSCLLAVNSPKLFIVFSAVFVSMSNLMLSMDRSFFINFIHVKGGLPMFFFLCFRLSFRAIFAGVSFFSRVRWPSQLSRLLLIVLLHGSDSVFLYSSSLLIYFGHLISITCLSIILWKESIWFSNAFVTVHNSELYRKVDAQSIESSKFQLKRYIF